MTDTSDKAVQEALDYLFAQADPAAPHDGVGIGALILASEARDTLRARIDFDAFALQDAIAHANDFADEAGAAEARLEELEAKGTS